jgi:hypothetical protein
MCTSAARSYAVQRCEPGVRTAFWNVRGVDRDRGSGTPPIEGEESVLETVLAAAQEGSGTNALFIVGLVVGGGWLASLWLHPFTACSACGGTPKSFGSVATRSFRLCSRCSGSGRRLRVGARMFARHRD